MSVGGSEVEVECWRRLCRLRRGLASSDEDKVLTSSALDIFFSTLGATHFTLYRPNLLKKKSKSDSHRFRISSPRPGVYSTF